MADQSEAWWETEFAEGVKKCENLAEAPPLDGCNREPTGLYGNCRVEGVAIYGIPFVPVFFFKGMSVRLGPMAENI